MPTSKLKKQRQSQQEEMNQLRDLNPKLASLKDILARLDQVLLLED
jgi:hypothetical protein